MFKDNISKDSVSTRGLINGIMTALLFGLHPLHVESVAWAAERKDLLCGLFFILSIIVYILYSSSRTVLYRKICFIACVSLYVISLMSKPMAVTLPAVLLLLDIYPLKRLVH
jgi:uncharacterized membrane protein